MKKIFPLLLTVTTFLNANAQNETDVLRLSMWQLTTTARSLGTGGAQGSIGGDYAAATINPAGLAKYSKSEIQITPSVRNTRIGASLNNSTPVYKNSQKTSLESASIVITGNKRNRTTRLEKALTNSVTIGYNKIWDLESEYQYKNDNIRSSIVNSHIETLNESGNGSQDLLNGNASAQQYLAYKAGLIGIASNGTLINNMPSQAGLYHGKESYSKGKLAEATMSIASNYQDKVLIGATLGLPMYRYVKTDYYVESNSNIKSNSSENINANGTGVNLILGAIYMQPKYRIGLSYKTPTAWTLNDQATYTQSINNGSEFSEGYAPFEYYVNTPGRLTASASKFFKSRGFISADIDLYNYSNAKIKFNEANNLPYANSVNNVIDQLYKNTLNGRIGGEWRLKNLALRAGVAYHGGPYSNALFKNPGARQSLNTGMSFRGGNIYLDAGYQLMTQVTTDIPYVLKDFTMPQANLATQRHLLLLTLGKKF